MRPMLTAALILGLLPGGASAAPEAAPSSPASPPHTITGLTVLPPPSEPILRRGVDTFVRSLTASQHDETLTRWHSAICPLVAGLARPQAEFVLARLTEVARQVGAPMLRSGCRPNLYVVASPTPKKLLEDWGRRQPDLFGNARPSVIARFIDTDRPVRVWHNWGFAPASGGEFSQSPSEYNGVPVNSNLVTDSRIVDNAERQTWEVIVIIDGTQVSKVKVAQLADYIVFTGLTEIDPDQPPSDAPTILHLFDSDASQAPAGLSEWDLAYLRAVYQVPQNDRMEKQMVASRMVEALRH